MKAVPLRRRQRGVALLVVLILLVMMSVLAGRISQQFCRSLQKTRYQVSQQQLRWAIQAQGKPVAEMLQRQMSSEETPLPGDGEWREPVITRGEFYTVKSTVSDAQTCFNVNSLLAVEPLDKANERTGETPQKPAKQQVLEYILTTAGVNAQTAQTVYEQLVDYLDADNTTASGAAEEDAWAGEEPARFPANQMMRTPGEIRRLPALPPQAWRKVSPWLCALPDTTSAVDLNTLRVDQAPLLSALFLGQINDDQATQLLASRPEAGWASVKEVEEQLEKQTSVSKAQVELSREFLAVNSHYFRVDSEGTTDDLTLHVVTQLHVDASSGTATTWQRRYRISE